MNAPPAEAGELTRELAEFVRPGPGPCGDPRAGWPALLSAAASYHLVPALWSALFARGVRPLPAEVRGPARDGSDADGNAGADADAELAPVRPPLALLEAAHRTNADRLADQRAQAVLVLDALEAAGVDALPVNGVHWLLAGWLPDPAARVLLDIDVVVPRALRDDGVRALQSVGYRPAPVALTRDPCGRRLALAGHAGSVELRVTPLAGPGGSLVDGDGLRERAVDVDVDGRTRRLPETTDALTLLVGGSQLEQGAARELRVPLRALVDVAAITIGGRVAADWDAVLARFARRPAASVAFAGFAAAALALFDVDLGGSARTRRGDIWYRGTTLAVRHPAATRGYRDAVSLPAGVRRRAARLVAR